jgi:hypothetical protein
MHTLNLTKYNFPEMNRYSVNGKRLYETSSGHLPSVTTILSATDKNKDGLRIWRERIGDVAADKIVKYSQSVGTIMHSNLEQYILGNPMDNGSNNIYKKAYDMANLMIKNNIENRLQEVLGVESNLFLSELYAGATDLIGVYDGVLSIIDFKNARKPKDKQYIENYYYQCAAYALAFENMFGVSIEQSVILITTQDMQTQQFISNGDTFKMHKDKWLDKVFEYYYPS